MFISYTEVVTLMFDRHGARHHLFADEKQVYADALLGCVDNVCSCLCDCTSDLICWCASQRLQLNDAKIELAWFGKPLCLASLSSMHRSVTIGSSIINPSRAVRNFGVILVVELTVKQQISGVTSSCFYPLPVHRSKHVRHSVCQELTRPAGSCVHVCQDSSMAILSWQVCPSHVNQRCKNVFYVFYLCHVFYVF